MTDAHGAPLAGQSDAHAGTVETAKHEAAAVADTTMGAARDVAHTAKDEAVAVAKETTSQLGDLVGQARDELWEQASSQQERLATGLRGVGDDLSTMADAADGGLAAELVRRASDRVSGAGAWLAQRDPAGVLAEVKRFARRRPAVFILGAAAAGIVAGRLVRALASSESQHTAPHGTNPTAQNGLPTPTPEQAPMYAASAARFAEDGREDADERIDSL